MTDTRAGEDAEIVKRLRSDGSSWAQELFNEAADTIERLTADRDAAHARGRAEALEEAATYLEDDAAAREKKAADYESKDRDFAAAHFLTSAMALNGWAKRLRSLIPTPKPEAGT